MWIILKVKKYLYSIIYMSNNIVDDSVFWITLSTGILAFLGLLVRQCFQSRCTEVSCCWNCINIKRDTEAEKEEVEYKIDNGITSGNDFNNQSNQQIIRPITRPPSPNQRYSRQNSLIQQIQSQLNSRQPSSRNQTIIPPQNNNLDI